MPTECYALNIVAGGFTAVPYILLIEDNQTNADMVKRVLNIAGYEVRHFMKGLDGTRAARAEIPSLILLDFDLPDIDGKNLILTLKRQLGGQAAPPIVALTAQTGDIERRIAARFGCDAFVSKPFEPQAFVELINKLSPLPDKKDTVK